MLPWHDFELVLRHQHTHDNLICLNFWSCHDTHNRAFWAPGSWSECWHTSNVYQINSNLCYRPLFFPMLSWWSQQFLNLWCLLPCFLTPLWRWENRERESLKKNYLLLYVKESFFLLFFKKRISSNFPILKMLHFCWLMQHQSV